MAAGAVGELQEESGANKITMVRKAKREDGEADPDIRVEGARTEDACLGILYQVKRPG